MPDGGDLFASLLTVAALGVGFTWLANKKSESLKKDLQEKKTDRNRPVITETVPAGDGFTSTYLALKATTNCDYVAVAAGLKRLGYGHLLPLFNAKTKRYGVACACAWLYSTEEIYKELNHALGEQHLEKIKHFLPLVKKLDELPPSARVTNTVVYRGSRISDADVEKSYQPGACRAVGFVCSTSKKLQVAKNFAKAHHNWVVEIHLPSTANYAFNIEPWSAFPTEAEVILLPGTLLKVHKVDKQSKRVVMKSVDQPQTPYNLLFTPDDGKGKGEAPHIKEEELQQFVWGYLCEATPIEKQGF
eukprot:TRINITY_DN74702_c0_g1_i1.p1 TRINITY_DN74702_c0_g1~~TRINITY_DN74702_c0_g1_i1.p1  ORF type:complete len:303 (+),score=11.93 TRINITY_DN74702_c0_g1_i1:32-940(+)